MLHLRDIEKIEYNGALHHLFIESNKDLLFS